MHKAQVIPNQLSQLDLLFNDLNDSEPGQDQIQRLYPGRGGYGAQHFYLRQCTPPES
jgi:hypothetical protein